MIGVLVFLRSGGHACKDKILRQHTAADFWAKKKSSDFALPDYYTEKKRNGIFLRREMSFRGFENFMRRL